MVWFPQHKVTTSHHLGSPALWQAQGGFRDLNLPVMGCPGPHLTLPGTLHVPNTSITPESEDGSSQPLKLCSQKSFKIWALFSLLRLFFAADSYFFLAFLLHQGVEKIKAHDESLPECWMIP